MFRIHFYLTLLLLSVLFSCQTNQKKEPGIINHGNIRIEFNNKMQSRVNANYNNAADLMTDFQYSEYLETANDTFKEFELDKITTSQNNDGVKWTIISAKTSETNSLQKVITVESFQNFPDLLTMQVSYINHGNADITVKKWVNHGYKINSNGDTPPFWSFQGGSYESRPDWVLPLETGFSQENYLGMNASDYGGGIPVTDIWRKDVGIAIGHLAPVPKLVSLPVIMNEPGNVEIGVHYERESILRPGDSLKTFRTFIQVHQGDYFQSLKQFSLLMQKEGLEFVESEAAAYEPIWCAWGYERQFNVDEILGTLPKVKELGIKWAVLDDGFQIAEGDWDVNPEKFPGGDADMIKFVDKIHSYGLKAKLWWAPLAVDPGTKLLHENPDIILLNEDGSPRDISWWDSYYMSPAIPFTIEHTKEMITKFLDTWGYDGLKMDGQHMNGVPPDYNSSHNLDYPELSVEKLPEFFQTIYNTARDIKPHAVIENCPCGTTCSFYNMPSMNQSVSSDPMSSWQIRLKGKTFKALMGKTAYYGDHVELSDGGNDFASSFGIGAVLGTKFTWPKDNPHQSESFLLTPEKEKVWKKWFSLYNQKMLSRAPYIGNLYDIGYDKPETHVVKKDDTMYYAFYANNWDSEIELRGLQNKKYQVIDYINEKDYGIVDGSDPKLKVSFEKFLLLEVIPK